MVRTPLFDKNGIKKGAWSPEEDAKLEVYITRYGHSNWRELPKFAGLQRCGKSCRLRWMNYLRPDVKRGNYSRAEEDLIMELHRKHGNKWAMIATKLPGRTDNEIKNYWHTHLKKRSSARDSSSSFDDRSQTSLSGSESSAGSKRSQKQVSSGGNSSTSNQTAVPELECLQHIQILESCPFLPPQASSAAVSLSSTTGGGIPVQADGLFSDLTSPIYPITHEGIIGSPADCFFPDGFTSLIYPMWEEDNNNNNNNAGAELMAEESAATEGAVAGGAMEDVYEEMERIDVDFWTTPFELEELSFYDKSSFSDQNSTFGYELMASSYMSHNDETLADLF